MNLGNPKRLPGFPSWSWCGWKGPIKDISGPDQILYNLNRDVLFNSSLNLESYQMDRSLHSMRLVGPSDLSLAAPIHQKNPYNIRGDNVYLGRSLRHSNSNDQGHSRTQN